MIMLLYFSANQRHFGNLPVLRRNPIEDGAISGFGGQKSVPE